MLKELEINKEYLNNMPIRESKGGTYTLTEADKEYLKSKAVNGTIPIHDYIKAMNEILNQDYKPLNAI